MAGNYAKGLYRDYEALLTEKEKLIVENKTLRHQIRMMQKAFDDHAKLEAELARQTAELEALKKEILRLNGQLNLDGTNSGLPTSKTPLHKKKVIPNSREKGTKARGGQPGHAKSKLEAFADNEITETQKHELSLCPRCGGDLKPTGEETHKDELDYEVVVIKKRHIFPSYKCQSCGQIVHQAIPEQLKEENQYGSRVPALALALMDIGNVSVNKVRKMIYGLSEEAINPSEGYIIKTQKKAAKALEPFMKELQKACLKQPIIHWDDTVIAINQQRGCLRFYGNEYLALYTAHMKKDKKGIDADGILPLLPKETIVVHDHNIVNYNKGYSFSNAECNVHLQRDLQKTTDNLHHCWAQKLSQLMSTTNSQRNEAITRNETAFTDEYVKRFFETFDAIMLEALEENQADENKYYQSDEKVLIVRILDYKDNYFSWVVNFQIPYSNNISERSLRGVKSKQKIAGQFQNEGTAQNYAVVKSYIETCYRNGINEMEALIRLCQGKPYTAAELLEP